MRWVAPLVFAAGFSAFCHAEGAPPKAPANACPAKESHQFDFWIGDWNVSDPTGKRVGHNRIEAIVGGCALSENWDSATGNRGKSYNAYDAPTKTWQQFWVDAHGGVLHLTGGIEGKSMVLRSTRPGAHVDRITWTPNDDDTVRQLWESSEDSGKTWKTEFDGRYERVPHGDRA
jgi:hypothetical protein